jgi:hypothetical protein
MRVDETNPQDHMAWETQGPIVDRSVERLGTTDRGIVMLREMFFREIERMRQGHDPLGVIRDPNHPEIDTGLTTSLEEYVGQWRGPADQKPADWDTVRSSQRRGLAF